MRLPEALLLSAALLCAQGAAAQPAEQSAGQAAAAASTPPALSASAVQAAIEAVRADPLLPGMEKERVLRFKEEARKDKPKDPNLDWWLDLLASLSGGMRVAVWLIGAALLIWVLLRLRDWLVARRRGPVLAELPPTHVGSLDIRPESLPADIGAAARALWQRGEMRAALSLLYRGALSRLVHAHGVAIRAASTESDCLALAQQRLAAEPQAYLRQLIAGWQAVAYARRELPAEELEQLCASFDARLSAQGARP
ncbi:DUF4129 domain-containing protein [Pelomonas sp. V22]|uniref:DUF4129 domain-containing protein n=1 Tax=Pelomonas sp. V22 TaxID=2822139 RepID=UPI0024A7CAF7|nr:DUF4129 domain-containing protein [Pelomonas sp. V22]